MDLEEAQRVFAENLTVETPRRDGREAWYRIAVQPDALPRVAEAAEVLAANGELRDFQVPSYLGTPFPLDAAPAVIAEVDRSIAARLAADTRAMEDLEAAHWQGLERWRLVDRGQGETLMLTEYRFREHLTEHHKAETAFDLDRGRSTDLDTTLDRTVEKLVHLGVLEENRFINPGSAAGHRTYVLADRDGVNPDFHALYDTVRTRMEQAEEGHSPKTSNA